MTDSIRLASVDTERALIGSIQLDDKTLPEIRKLLRASDFSLDSHQRIFARIEEMQDGGRAVDVITLTEEFLRREEEESIGGIAYLVSLTEGLPRRMNVVEYAHIIRGLAARRKLHAEAVRLATATADPCASVEDFTNQFESLLELSSEIDKPLQDENRFLVDAGDFVSSAPERVDWLIEDVIERGANGFFVAVPKGGKSWAAIDMLISLALGCPWLDFRVPRAVRCALISREDNPSLTAWRLRHLFASKQCGGVDLLRQNLYLNSRKQSPELMLDNPGQVAELIGEFKKRQIEFAVFDVFNVLHASDENDNTQMRAVLRQLTRIQTQTGCSIGVVHHFNKADTGGLTQRMRGASSIAGWAEWLIGITLADEETKTRRMEFELKAAQPPEPIHYRIDSDAGGARLVRTLFERKPTTAGNSRAARLMQ